jgi:uncharacterized RDD family membrane protein YckC
MVLPDWSARPQAQKLTFEPQNNSVQFNGHTMLARPLDRLAAVIVDMFIVLGPIYILLSAPFKNWMTTNLLAGGGTQMESLIAGMLGIAVGLVVVYQTFFTYFFRGTLGKLLFDLRVQPMFEGERVSAWDCFIRSWLWIGEIVLLGIPFLSIFSNSKRRPIHDRLCDTIVVARTNAGVKAPALWERGLVRGMFAILLTLGLMTLAAQLRGGISDKVDAGLIGAFEEADAGACEVVSRDLDENAVAEDPDAAIDEHRRLSKAMTLYAAGLADRSCLEAEVELEMADQVPVGPITYLAQAFVYADDPETSNSYIDEVCASAPESVECHMSQVVSKWSDEDWESVEEAITKAPKGSGYLEIWGVRHYMKQAQYGRALDLLNSSLTEKSLSEFAMVQRVKALFNSYREPEAESALMQAVSALPEESSYDLSAWVCAQQLQNGCSALEAPACRHFQKDLGGETQEIDFEQTNAALAQILTLECQNEGKIDYLSFQDAIQNADWTTFFRANLKRQREDKGTAGELFSQIIMSPDAPELLKVEAARRWAQIADLTQLEDMVEQWRDLSSREVWVKEGNILFKRLAEIHQPKLALKVANYLVQGESLSPEAIAALGSMVDATQTIRAPASAKGKK